MGIELEAGAFDAANRLVAEFGLNEIGRLKLAGEISQAISLKRIADAAEAIADIIAHPLVQAESSLWYEWVGYGQTPAGTVRVRFKDGSEEVDSALRFDWTKLDHPKCIVAWRREAV